MASSQVQISAYISTETRDLVERYARAQGIKKGFLIESALLHHLEALQEIPADVIIPPRLVVSQDAGQQVLEAIAEDSEPTEAMATLMSDTGEGEGGTG